MNWSCSLNLALLSGLWWRDTGSGKSDEMLETTQPAFFRGGTAAVSKGVCVEVTASLRHHEKLQKGNLKQGSIYVGMQAHKAVPVDT